MKKRNFKKTLLGTSILTTLFLSAGCNKNYVEDENINFTTTEGITTQTNIAKNTTEKVIEEINTTSENTTEKVTEEEIDNTEQKVQETTTEEIYNIEEQTEENITEQNTEVSENNNFDNFNEEVNNLNYFYDERSYDEVKEYGKKLFIRMVDYIFYDTEINGTTFNELNEECKQEVYDNLKKTDEIIMMVEPNYKETIGDKYNIVKDFTAKKYNEALDLIKEKIGEEKYDEIGEKKDEVLEKTKETGNQIKEGTKKKVKSWYEDFKSNN